MIEFFNGYEIKQHGAKWKIKGLAMEFYSLEQAKNHIITIVCNTNINKTDGWDKKPPKK